jgi:hypothetical protein
MPVVTEELQLPVREARAGEPAAWEALLARYRLPLYAYVYELVHQEQTSLDIVQEAFINAARHIRTLQRDEKFGSWLFNIAHQKCIQHWRKQRPADVPIDLLDEVWNVTSPPRPNSRPSARKTWRPAPGRRTGEAFNVRPRSAFRPPPCVFGRNRSGPGAGRGPAWLPSGSSSSPSPWFPANSPGPPPPGHLGPILRYWRFCRSRSSY